MQGLTEFFREKKQRAEAETAGVDWEQAKQGWLNAIESLYRQIHSLVGEAAAQGSLQLSRRMKTISEDHLGTYDVPELVLTVGDERVIFSPRGRNVVGAEGRVDVIGESGESTLVFRSGPQWSIVISRFPQLRTVALDAPSFAEMLRGVMRP